MMIISIAIDPVELKAFKVKPMAIQNWPL